MDMNMLMPFFNMLQSNKSNNIPVSDVQSNYINNDNQQQTKENRDYINKNTEIYPKPFEKNDKNVRIIDNKSQDEKIIINKQPPFQEKKFNNPQNNNKNVQSNLNNNQQQEFFNNQQPNNQQPNNQQQNQTQHASGNISNFQNGNISNMNLSNFMPLLQNMSGGKLDVGNISNVLNKSAGGGSMNDIIGLFNNFGQNTSKTPSKSSNININRKNNIDINKYKRR